MKHDMKKVSDYASIAFLAMLSALNYIIFVFPNHFAPAGLDGICTMIQDVLGINMGYLALMLNIPMLIAVFFLVSRPMAVRSGVYIVSFSTSLILLKSLDLSRFIYASGDSSGMIFAAIAAGTIRGILYAYTLRVEATSGGSDLAAALIRKHSPHLDLMNLIFTINMTIALASYFVYGYQYEPVICSILYSFIVTNVSNHITSSSRVQIRYEIITSNYQDVCREILSRCNTTSTIVDAHGAFADTDNKVVICVTDRKKAPRLEALVSSFSNTVIFKSEVDHSLVTHT